MASRGNYYFPVSSKEEEKSESPKLPTELPYDFLKMITNDFGQDRKISEGLFGALYKGIIPIDGAMIVVKKLRENEDSIWGTGDKEDWNSIGLKHENIVEVVGFCRETTKRLVQRDNRYIIAPVSSPLLCYEYLPMGSLQENLFGKKEAQGAYPAKPNINWDTRFKIINGICLGLCFLHTLDIPIIHMDLKPENIFLDSKMVPKIADFALSTVFGHEETRLCTKNVAGSYAYMAPEYLYRGEISTKTDIYSLGVMIIEITTGEKNCPENNQPSARTFIEKVQNIWGPEHTASKYSSLDPGRLRQIRRCIEIGLHCVNINQIFRPPIENIVDMLKGIS